MTLPTLYKLSDAVKALGPGAPCEDTLRAEVRAGRLVAKRIGRCLRISDVELTRWALDTSTPSAPAPHPAPAEEVPGPSSGVGTASGPGDLSTSGSSSEAGPPASPSAGTRPASPGGGDPSPVGPAHEPPARFMAPPARGARSGGGSSLEQRSA